MAERENFKAYFDNILNRLEDLEKSSQTLVNVKEVKNDITDLETYIRTAFETLDHQYQNYVNQINLLSELIEFQRQVIRYKSPEEVNKAIFQFLESHIPFEQGFIYFRVSEDDDDFELITPHQHKIKVYREFLEESNLSVFNNLISKRDLGLLFTNVYEFQKGHIPWHKLRANSIILFPIRVRDQFLGFGLLVREKEPFSISHLSFVNLNIGTISLLLFQHHYFYRLKSRLFKQFKLKKILEEVKYAEYFEKGPLFIFTLDPRGIILHTNASALEKIHLDEDVILGEKFLNLLPPRHRKPFENILNQLKEGEVRFYKAPILVKDGGEIILEFYISKLELQERFTLNIIFAVDSTREYFLELQERREEVLSEISQFAKVISAQVNNLLTILVPNVSLMRTKLPDDHEFQKYLQTMEKYIQQTTGLVQKFLNFDLPEFEPPRILNVNQKIQELIESFDRDKPTGITVKLSLDPSIPKFQVCPARLQKLLKILFENSVDALSGEGEIRIATKLVKMVKDGLLLPHQFYLKRGQYVEISFADNGIGIDSRFLPHIFKPFFSTKVKNEGVGLGLFIAYNIVKNLKGEIFVKSQPNEGTTFYIYLPTEGEIEMQKELPGMEEVLQPKPPAILVVDDEYNIRSMLQEIFEMNGYCVYTASNGQEAVEIFKKHASEIELVVLDMVMPIMDGRTTFMHIQKMKPDQKVIIVSGYAQREDIEDMLNKGALFFLRKPFQVGDILNKVKEVLSPHY